MRRATITAARTGAVSAANKELYTFPGSAMTGACMIAGPILAVVSSVSAIGSYHSRGADFAGAMAAHPLQAVIGMNMDVVAIVLLFFAVIGLAQAISAVRPQLGRTGGILTLLGLFGPIFFPGVYFGAFQLANAGNQAAAALLIDRAHIPSTVVNLCGPALVIGFILLAIGAVKAGVLGKARAWALGATCLIPAGFISGYIVISALAFACTAVALVPMGIGILRARKQNPECERGEAGGPSEH
jgi:hypothetical protein